VLLHWTGPGNVSWPACTTGKLPCNDHYTLRKNGVWVVNFPMSTLSTKQVYVKGVRWSLSVTAKDRYGVAKGSNQVFWLTP
jgi:hypothetical protein